VKFIAAFLGPASFHAAQELQAQSFRSAFSACTFSSFLRPTSLFLCLPCPCTTLGWCFPGSRPKVEALRPFMRSYCYGVLAYQRCRANPRLPPGGKDRQRRVRRSLEGNGARRVDKGHQNRLRRRGGPSRRARTSCPAANQGSASSVSALAGALRNPRGTAPD